MKSSERKLKRVRPLLGTFVAIDLHGRADEMTVQSCMTAGFEAIAEVERLMSYFLAQSDLSRLNRADANQWLELHPLTVEVLRLSNELYGASGGLFDIRCGQALAAYGLLPALQGCHTVDLKFRRFEPPVEIFGHRARKTGPWIFDLGGIAKGFAVDRAVERIQSLTREKTLAGIVNAGGDLRIWGRKRFPVMIRLEGPVAPLTRSIAIGQTALATSSIRTDAVQNLAPAGLVRMPQGTLARRAQTATVFAEKCYLADALTKIALTAPASQASRILSFYQAKAMTFSPDGNLQHRFPGA